MRKLLLTIVTTAIIGTSFTSCIDNEVPEEIQNMYASQADLIAANAALKEAEAALKAAEVAAEEIANSFAEANNALLLAVNEANADVAIAEANEAIAKALLEAEIAKNALEEAKLQFIEDMKAMQQAIADGENQAIADAMALYTTAKSALSDSMRDEIDLQLAINQQIIDNTNVAITEAVALASLNSQLSDEEELKANSEAEIAELEALIADGSTAATNEERKLQLEADVTENEAKILILESSIAEKNADLVDANATLNDLTANFAGLQNNLNVAAAALYFATFDIENLEITNKTLSEENINLQNIVDNFDTMSAARDAAQLAYDLAAANLAEELDKNDELKAIADNASNELTTATSAYVAVLNEKSNSEANIIAATAALTDAQAEFDTAKGLFNADPTGTTWTDAGEDGVLGDHSDDGTSVTTYAEIDVVNVVDGTATFKATPVYVTFAALDDAGEDDSPNTWGSFTATDEGLYYNIELDDNGGFAPPTNEDRFIAATNGLDAAQNLATSLNLAAADIDLRLADAKVMFDELTVVFEAAREAYEAQQLIYNAAVEVTEEALNANNEALSVYNSFNPDNFTKAYAQAIITLNQGEIANNQNIITDLTAQKTALEAEIATLTAAIEAGMTPEIEAAQLAKDTLDIEILALETERDGLEDLNTRLAAIIVAIDMSGTSKESYEMMIETAQTELADIEVRISTVKNAIATSTDSTSINAAILANLEAQLIDLQDTIEIQTALVARAKAALDALI